MPLIPSPAFFSAAKKFWEQYPDAAHTKMYNISCLVEKYKKIHHLFPSEEGYMALFAAAHEAHRGGGLQAVKLEKMRLQLTQS